MTSKNILNELAEQYKNKEITRETYWQEMKRQHRKLLDYTSWICGKIIERIEIQHGELIMVLKNGLKLIWNVEDTRSAVNMIINHNEYETKESRLVEAICTSCNVIFDIGANKGWYSLHMARQLQKKKVEIFAFEPVPNTFQELNRNIQLNRFSKIIHAINIGFGNSNRKTEFFIPDITGSVAASQKILFPDEHNLKIECSIVTLDHFIEQQNISQLDFIKCDVEGAELLVLKGGLKTIERFEPILFLELLRKWSKLYDYQPNDVLSLLNSLGYFCFGYQNNDFVEFKEINEDCLQTNYFFLQKKHLTVFQDSLNYLKNMTIEEFK